MGEIEDGWLVEGEDAFDGTTYELGRHVTEQAALDAALIRLRKLEGSQPTASSGGQDGIQDRVYVTGPDGMRHRILRVNERRPIRPGECVDCQSGEPGQGWRLNMRSMCCDRGRGES